MNRIRNVWCQRYGSDFGQGKAVDTTAHIPNRLPVSTGKSDPPLYKEFACRLPRSVVSVEWYHPAAREVGRKPLLAWSHHSHCGGCVSKKGLQRLSVRGSVIEGVLTLVKSVKHFLVSRVQVLLGLRDLAVAGVLLEVTGTHAFVQQARQGG